MTYSKLSNIGDSEGTRESMKDSYKKHFSLAQEGKIPSSVSPHVAGLYGALSTRYIAADTPQVEPALWDELAPFLLMDEKNSINALAEYVVCQEDSKNGQVKWLRKLVNDTLQTVKNANDDYRAMAGMAMIQPNIYWRKLLDSDVKELLYDELLRVLPTQKDMIPEMYNSLDKEIKERIKKRDRID